MFIAIICVVACFGLGIIVVNDSGELSIPLLSSTPWTPPDPNDSIIGAYLSNDGSIIARFYVNGTYVFKSLIHPSTSFGNWSNNGNNHYSLYLYSTESEGKIVYANLRPLSQALGYDLANGVLSDSDYGDQFRKISANPDEVIQGYAYPTISAETPINRQVGVEVKRVDPGSISVKVVAGKDVTSLVSLHVMANGKEAPMTNGKIAPQIGSMAYYDVGQNTDIIVIAEFYDYSRYNVWAGKI
jgi:hypothetical protein